MKEVQVTIQSGVQLKGSLSIPTTDKEKNPAIVIVPGTGKLDRNGRVNKKLDLQLYRQLAEKLTEMGYVTLRYDKRGIGESEGDFNRTGMWDLVSDVQEAVRFLKNRPEVDSEKVIILGHSEGSMLGTAAAVREPIAGLILLAGAVETLDEATKRQRELAAQDILEFKGFLGWYLRLLGVPNKIEKQAQKYTKKVMESTEDVIKVQFQPINAKWMREHFTHNIREDLTKVTCPVLAITGARDIQANPEVLKQLPNYVKGDSEYHIVENMGHSLKYQAKTSNMLSAKKDIIAEASLPLHTELVELIEGWLNGHFADTREENIITI
ncbi:alpha/beta hydrolase [Bacillus suaedaesalsae]|uniref:Alpha/beta hydrolase n=1 Tax=Bacillus suaedaesalsae TaxID=2810349 RepID=A0ABS2DF70_9BACI|nr:alpha/beta hydrolase [Bacillus suaedaesalsae]MBM6617122.1 alpha/beta hydrolase [Bacillus suaedaesalsae]